MACELYLGGRGGVWRSPDMDAGAAFAPELEMAVHPLALEYAPEGGDLMTSALGGGVWRSEAGSGRWAPCNAGLEEREVWALAHDPVSGAWFAGTQPAEVWRLAPGAVRWERLADLTTLPEAAGWHFPVPPNVAHVRAVACHPRRPQTMYCGIEVGGVLKSEDGGSSWRSLEGVGRDVHRIICLPQYEDAVLVTTGDDTPPYRREGGFGTYLSLDGGASWEQRVEGLGQRTYSEDAVALDPADPDRVFLVAVDGVPPDWAGFGDGSTYWMTPRAEVRESGADVRVYRGRISAPGWEPMMEGLPDPLFDMVWAFDVRAVGGGTRLVLGTTAGAIHVRDGAEGRWRPLGVAAPDPLVSHLRMVPR